MLTKQNVIVTVGIAKNNIICTNICSCLQCENNEENLRPECFCFYFYSQDFVIIKIPIQTDNVEQKSAECGCDQVAVKTGTKIV